LITTAEIAFGSFDSSVHGFISKDISQTNSIIDSEKEILELQKEITPLPLFVNSNNISILGNIIAIRESIKEIAHYAADIGELTIDRTYKSSEITYLLFNNIQQCTRKITLLLYSDSF
jgi:hypothetical protein